MSTFNDVRFFPLTRRFEGELCITIRCDRCDGTGIISDRWGSPEWCWRCHGEGGLSR